jgi:TonB-dependent SusC/RagA subfamily outer membrane receptor
LILKKLSGLWVDEIVFLEEPVIVIPDEIDTELFLNELQDGILYVIDAVPYYLVEIPDLNPEDIFAVEVLKDWTAEAIYGERGKNGVVLITTKESIESINPN